MESSSLTVYISLKKNINRRLKYAPFSKDMMKLRASTKTLIVKTWLWI